MEDFYDVLWWYLGLYCYTSVIFFLTIWSTYALIRKGQTDWNLNRLAEAVLFGPLILVIFVMGAIYYYVKDYNARHSNR